MFILWCVCVVALVVCCPEVGSTKVVVSDLDTLPQAHKDGDFQFIPVPVFETDPADGQVYGFMPTYLWLDRNDQLITLAFTAVTFNPQVSELGAFAGVFFFPSPLETLRVFILGAQHIERELYVQYLNEGWWNRRLTVETEVQFLRDPFQRFFGFGPDTQSGNESNFTATTSYWKARGAYTIRPHLAVQLEEQWLQLGLGDAAVELLPATTTRFAGNREVRASNQWTHRGSLIWDTRDNREMPLRGQYLEGYGLLAHEPFAGATVYGGYGAAAKTMETWGDRWTTAVSLQVKQLFGHEIPFFMQPTLGGENALRGFVERRFTGRGLVLLDLEERIRVKRFTVLGTKFDFSIDPFVAVGQVFDRWSELSMRRLQPVAGVGFRAKLPPSVVGRVDIGVGREGPAVYTTMSYPF